MGLPPLPWPFFSSSIQHLFNWVAYTSCICVVISKRQLICMHIHVIVYVWQGSMSWVHNYLVTPSIMISQVCSWVVCESMCSHNSTHKYFKVHKSMYVRAYVYIYRYFEMSTIVLRPERLQYKEKVMNCGLCEGDQLVWDKSHCLGSMSRSGYPRRPWWK